MNELALARAFHVIGVVFWIGGVAMVTTVLLPAMRTTVEPRRRVDVFEAIEGRFAWQSRFTTLLTAATGFYLVVRLDLWHRFQEPGYWWMHAMVAVWTLFTLMLFVLEPLVLRRWFGRVAERRPERVFALLQRLHWALLIASLITVVGAVLGAHGGL
ncbi:MAG: hypothetical protein U1F52_04640 [Burkholderiales bacterium]